MFKRRPNGKGTLLARALRLSSPSGAHKDDRRASLEHAA